MQVSSHVEASLLQGSCQNRLPNVGAEWCRSTLVDMPA